MSRAGMNASLLSQQPQQQQQFSGGMNHGGYSAAGSGMGTLGFPSLVPDPSLGAPGAGLQSGAMRAPGPNAMRAPGPMVSGPMHGRQVMYSLQHVPCADIPLGTAFCANTRY